MTRMLVLAGGAGTRLRPAVPDLPKALAPVNGVPFLEYQIHNWLSQGIRHFTFLLHHMADDIIAYLETANVQLRAECTLDWVVEPRPLDTGGAVAFAVHQQNISGAFLVSNADTWIGGGISELIEMKAPAMSVIWLPNTSRYCCVEISDGGMITSFTEKMASGAAGYINAGLTKLDASLFSSWDQQALSLERDVYPELLKMGLRACKVTGSFVDIGVPEDYLNFCNDFVPQAFPDDQPVRE